MEAGMAGASETMTTIDLGYEQMFVFDGGAGARVRVLYGATWLTEEGRPADAVVRTGEEVVLHGGRVLVEGLAPARLRIVGAPATSLARQAANRLRQAARNARRWLGRLQLGTTASVGRI
jgi:hypothetical protein